VPSNRPRQILIVDDDGTIRTLLAAALEERGYRVIAVANGLSMRDVLIHGGIDGVVLDVRMPDEDGHSLALHARELGLAVVMMSGSGEEIAFAERLGLQLLRKPFRMQQLFGALDAALGSAVGGA
jgi:DNA-binding response OmpR family regulator